MFMCRKIGNLDKNIVKMYENLHCPVEVFLKLCSAYTHTYSHTCVHMSLGYGNNCSVSSTLQSFFVTFKGHYYPKTPSGDLNPRTEWNSTLSLSYYTVRLELVTGWLLSAKWMVGVFRMCLCWPLGWVTSRAGEHQISLPYPERHCYFLNYPFNSFGL